jgi:hypothetical protein
MRDFIRHTLLWITVIMACVYAYGQFCDWFFTQPRFLDSAINKRAWNLKHRNQSYDFVVLGNSRAYGVFDMPLLCEKIDKKGINIAAGGSSFIDNYLTLNLFLRNNNKVKEVILQVDLWSLNSKEWLTESFHKYHFIQYWQDPIVRKTINDFSGKREEKVFTVLPELRYIKFNKYFSFKEIVRRYFQRDIRTSGFDISLGGVSYQAIEKPPVMENKPYKKDHFKIDPKDMQYLINIILICKQNNIKLTAFKAPEFEPFKESIINYNEVYGQIEELLTKWEVPYLFLNSEIDKDIENFYEGGHLRKQGLKPFTELFSKEYNHLSKFN